MACKFGGKELKAIETPVLIAWVRRCVAKARRVAEPGSTAHMAPCYPKEIGHAEAALRELEAHSGPPVFVRDPEDDSEGTVEFSRESKAWMTLDCAARVLGWEASHRCGNEAPGLRDPYAYHAEREMDAFYDDLMRNIAVEA